MHRTILIFLFVFQLTAPTVSQTWPKVYGDESSAVGRYVIETYDKGYIFLGIKNSYTFAWIVKTDINGDMLWYKRIGEANSHNYADNIEETNDNGYILAGSTSQYDSYVDPYIQKLNSCLEPEWCKLLYFPGDNDYGEDVKQVEDKGYVLLTRYLGHNHFDNRIHLTKFDSFGDIQWQHVYAHSDTLIFAEEGMDLTILDENRYLITGWCYYPDPGETGGWRRPFLILTDSLGNDVWELPVVFDGYYHGYALSSILHKNYIYTCGQHIATSGGYPCIVKTTLDGNEIYTSDILTQGIYIGALGTVDPVNDSMLYVTGAWSSEPGSDETYTAFMKIDTLGNLIDSIIYMQLSNNIKWTTKTYDGKFVSVGTHYDGNWDMYAFKINENMEYDSIYTQPFTYDSLCPDITSETFDLECDILVDIEEPFTTGEGSHLKIYPNPASEKIKIVLPEYTVSKQQTGIFEVSKVHYGLQGPAELFVYDMFGRKVKSLHLSKNQTQTEIDVSRWKSGIYLIELRSEGKMLDKGKFVVN